MSRYILSYLIILLAVEGVAAVNEPMIAKVASGTATVAMASWWGFDPADSTSALQAAINSGAKKLIVNNVGKPWVVRPISLASNQEIIFEKGVEVIAKRGEFKGKNDCLFRADRKQNVSLVGYGAIVRMHRSDYARAPYEKAEWRHVLSFKSCSNIKVKGLTLAESGGDGIYLGTAKAGITNKSILIKDVVCDKNYRQGISVITAEDLLIENTIMRNTDGTPPQDGIDFEPNEAGERLVNVVMRNCTTLGNSGDGYALYLIPLDASSKPVSIRIENCKSLRENSAGVRIVTGNGPKKAVKGKIEFVNCSFQDDIDPGVIISSVPVGGCRVRFVNCSILDAAAKEPTAAPIMFQSRRDATEPIGGVEFVNCTIRDSHRRNPIVYQDRAGGVPVRAVTGTLNSYRQGKKQTIKITPELLAKWVEGR